MCEAVLQNDLHEGVEPPRGSSLMVVLWYRQ